MDLTKTNLKSRVSAIVLAVCLLLMAGAWFVILAVYQPVSKRPWSAGQAHRRDLVFLDSGDLVYPVLVVAAAFLAAADGDGQEVCMKHYLQAIRYEFVKTGRVFTRSDFEPYASLVGL